jgi:glycosyltransferase involved in cell wall biosynthesis
VNFYWYWPYLRREELGLAAGLVGDGDRLVVHTTPRPTDPIVSPNPHWEVRPTLPAVEDRSEGSATWVASRGLTYARRALARRRAVDAGDFDVCHVVYLNQFTDPLDLWALRRKVPLVSTVHDVVPHNSRVPAAVERRLLAAQYRNAGTLLVHHEAVGERLVREFDLDPDRVVVVPLQIPVIDMSEGRERAHPSGARERARSADAGATQDASADAGAPRQSVLFFGTFRRNKGIVELLDAIEQLRGETAARFVFAGRGFPDVEQLVLDAAQRDPRIVTEIGYATADRKNELHATADLMVLPYTSFASQSAVLQDAYAHRLPVVVTDVGALGETVRGDGTGWVVPPSDSEHLGASILAALRDEPGLRAASAAADAIARDRTPVLTGRRYRAVYERAAGAGT